MWIKNGTVNYNETTGSGNSIMQKSSKTVECQDIKEITEHKIDLLKVNIEGAEMEVLKRVNYDNVNQILVEFHQWIGDRFEPQITKDDVDNLVNEIINKGYTFKKTDKHPDYLFTKI